MSMDKVKTLAIAKLKSGESIESISEELDVSVSIVKEWEDSLLPGETIAKEVNAIALQKASVILNNTEVSDVDNLQVKLLSLAIAITNVVKNGIQDHEIAKAINVSADTIAKLQNAFFAKGQQIAIINNNNSRSSSETNELKHFKELLKK